MREYCKMASDDRYLTDGVKDTAIPFANSANKWVSDMESGIC